MHEHDYLSKNPARINMSFDINQSHKLCFFALSFSTEEYISTADKCKLPLPKWWVIVLFHLTVYLHQRDSWIKTYAKLQIK